GTSVDRQCGSSQQSAHFAAQGVIAGAYDVVIAAGVECMTRVPMGVTMNGPGMPFGPKMMERYQAGGGLVPQGISAEMIADKWGLSRDDLDAFGVESHKRAARATEEGRFEKEIIPITVETESGKEEFLRDQAIHPDMEDVNVNGGAIALGHPLGCSGARLLATLVCELERSGGRWGLETMCEGGGMANATIIERLG